MTIPWRTQQAARSIIPVTLDVVKLLPIREPAIQTNGKLSSSAPVQPLRCQIASVSSNDAVKNDETSECLFHSMKTILPSIPTWSQPNTEHRNIHIFRNNLLEVLGSSKRIDRQTTSGISRTWGKVTQLAIQLTFTHILWRLKHRSINQISTTEMFHCRFGNSK